MENIRIHILHCGRVCVSPHLPFGGRNCSRRDIMKRTSLITAVLGCFLLLGGCGASDTEQKNV